MVTLGVSKRFLTLLGQKVQATKRDAMAGFVEKTSDVIEDPEKGTATRDVS
jgi:ferritin-like metal-binding protein YciE